jgi:hypothetical protein
MVVRDGYIFFVEKDAKHKMFIRHFFEKYKEVVTGKQKLTLQDTILKPQDNILKNGNTQKQSEQGKTIETKLNDKNKVANIKKDPVRISYTIKSEKAFIEGMPK